MLAPEMNGAETTRRDAGGIDPNFERLPGVLEATNSTLADSLKAIRASWLMRRVPLSAGMAAAVGALLFEGGA